MRQTRILFSELSSIGRRNISAAVYSHCTTLSYREGLVLALERWGLAHSYGGCGRPLPGSPEDAHAVLSRRYLFYLAFENALCEDYATEKFFLALQNPWVPVVHGGADYERLAPKGSFIKVKDFPTLADLARYLKYLEGHPTEYAKYFEWKRHKYAESGHSGVGCRVCEALHSPPRVRHRRLSVMDDRGDCKEPGVQA